MKLDEAIGRLGKVYLAGLYFETTPDKEAIKLGIEALKAIRTGREDYYEAGGHRLPGETEY